MINTYKVIQRYLEKMGGVGKSKYLDQPLKVMDQVFSSPIIVFDTETTGLDAHRNQITEIGAIRMYGTEELDSFHRKITLHKDTEELEQSQNKAVEMAVAGRDPMAIRSETGLPFDMVKEIVQKKDKFFGITKVRAMQQYDPIQATHDEMQALTDFNDWCEKRPSIMLGQNAAFDLKMINTRLGRQVPNRGVYDTVFLTRFYLYPALEAASAAGDERSKQLLDAVRDKKGKPSASMGPALSALGVKIEGWHGAMADVKSTISLLRGIYAHLKTLGNVQEDPEYQKAQQEAFTRTLGYKRKKQKP